MVGSVFEFEFSIRKASVETFSIYVFSTPIYNIERGAIFWHNHYFFVPFVSFSFHFHNLVFGCFWWPSYIIVYLLFLLSKTRQAKTEHMEMKILQLTFGILVVLTKNKLTKICNEPGKNPDGDTFFIWYEINSSFNHS